MEIIRNLIEISGFPTAIEFSHECKGIKFYTFKIKSQRSSGFVDILNCVAQEDIAKKIVAEEMLTLYGEVRTRNADNKVYVYIYVQIVQPYYEHNKKDLNKVEISGFICKKPNYKITHKGRQITSTIIACHRLSRWSSDYVPCIAWGWNAIRLADMPVGTKLKVTGRFQARNYLKKINDGTLETRTAYEVSVSRIDVVESEE